MAAFDHHPAFRDLILLAVHSSFPVPDAAADAALSAGDILDGRHRQPDCPAVPLSIFRDLPYILLKEGNNLHDRSMAMFAAAGFTPKVRMALSQMVTAYRLADNGIGAAFVSDRLVRSRNSNLRFFRLDAAETERLFYFLLPERNYTAFSVKAFMEFAESCGMEPDRG